MRRLCVIIASVLLVFPSLSAQDDGRREKLEHEIEILDAQLKQNASKSASALNKLTLIRKKVSNRKALVSESDREIARIDNQLYAKQREINRLNERLDTMSVYYSRLVRSAYKNRDARIWYMYLLSSSSLSEAARRYGYLKNLSSRMNEQALKIKQTREEITAQKKDLSRMREAAQKLRDKRASELKALRSDEKISSSTVTRLKKEKTKYQKELSKKKSEMEALNRELKKAVSVKSSKPVDYKLAAEFESNKGKLPWPVDGAVVDSYGQHYHPVYKSVKLPFNNGVTLAVAREAKVYAVFDGVVKQVIVMPGYNQCVLVQHGNYFTFYCKLKSVSVKAGSKVSTSQMLGTVDTIGGETQFHFQLWKDRTPQDPEKWLR